MNLNFPQAKQEKAERTKELGSPVELPGKVLDFVIRGAEAWTAESGHVVRRTDLEVLGRYSNYLFYA